jgi:superfamily II DNA or RNA helicase
MTLRGYQLRCLDAIREGWKQWRRQFVEQATGCGKTFQAAIAAKEEVEAGGKVLFIAHTEELIDQAIREIEASTGISCGKEKAESHATLFNKIVVASVQTLCRESRLSGWPKDHFTLIIVDECHRGAAVSYTTILDYFDSAKVLGFTATADRGDHKDLAEVFDNRADKFDLRDAVADGWLVRPVVKTLPVKIDMRGVTTKRTPQGNDYDPEEVARRIQPIINALVAEIAKEIGDRRTVIFLPSIMLSRLAAEAFCKLGVRAQFVSGECPDRTEKMQRLRNGDVQVTMNAMLLTEGFDDPWISCICVLRLTKIRGLLAQCVGRGTRPLKAIIPALNAEPSPTERQLIIQRSAKPNMLILDPLWLTDTLSLVRPTDLVVSNTAIAEHAKGMNQQGDLLDLADMAGRDYLKALAKRMKEVQNRKARVIDPLAFAVQTKDEDLETYEPSSRWEMVGVSPEQAKLLTNLGIDVTKVTSKGYASMLITKLLARRKANMSSVQQMSFLARLGVHDTDKLTHAEAKARIDSRLAELRGRSPQAKKQEPQMTLSEIPKERVTCLEIE